MQDSTSDKKDRPIFRNIHITDILRYHLPIAGFVSILHRISGLLMCVGLGFVLYVLDLSLRSEEGYLSAVQLCHCALVKVIAIVALWCFFHHFFAGIRFLLLDCHCGLSKTASRYSARIVMILAIIYTIMFGVALW